ncbi:hypothetical protein AcW1_006661 [Taiwanofungus camphoratus]|nr:hypothetical protein AcV7_007409 [Antrodia cinnamomea]KAI0954910.1 hypothetical protein AcW1_006661 [Antrodia cinnamomea]
MRQCMLSNHKHWYHFATKVFGLDPEEVKLEDIIFVSGWVKTADWAVAASMCGGRDITIAFNGRFGSAAKFSVSLSASREVAMKWRQQSASSRETQPRPEQILVLALLQS